jgi:hypothetical protein
MRNLPPAVEAMIGIRFRIASETFTSKPSRVDSCVAHHAPCIRHPKRVSEGGALTIDTSAAIKSYALLCTIYRGKRMKPCEEIAQMESTNSMSGFIDPCTVRIIDLVNKSH